MNAGKTSGAENTAGAISVFIHLIITILGDEIALPRGSGAGRRATAKHKNTAGKGVGRCRDLCP